MRQTILFIAMSLDGYIADSDGGVGWLNGQGSDDENVDTYSEFVKEIDTVLMGGKTYRQIVTELSPDEWIYGNLKTYVITHAKQDSAENIVFTDEKPTELLKRLAKEQGKNIWICGGADLVNQLMAEDMIDRYYISVIPTLLGAGIRLFGHTEKEIPLKLLKSQTYNGIAELIYECR